MADTFRVPFACAVHELKVDSVAFHIKALVRFSLLPPFTRISNEFHSNNNGRLDKWRKIYIVGGGGRERERRGRRKHEYENILIHSPNEKANTKKNVEIKNWNKFFFSFVRSLARSFLFFHLGIMLCATTIQRGACWKVA